MLTLALRDLERDGVVRRTVHPEVPPRVEYELTTFGESLRPIVNLMRDWGAEWKSRIIKTRQIVA
jgi:DNA-binding HxlR family transcriptional regulator